MKKGWLCRTSDDEIVYTWWWPVEIQIEWWSRSSYDDSERSRSSDDPDPAVEIQIEWWSRSSSSDPDRVMIQIQSSDDDPDPVMIKIQWWRTMMIQIRMTWRWRWLEDEDDLKTRWSSWYKEEDQCWKLCRKNTFLVKRECWCICNFGMYSSMYLMYCNPMFIPRCFYYVFDSCGHAPMFRSGGLIM